MFKPIQLSNADLLPLGACMQVGKDFKEYLNPRNDGVDLRTGRIWNQSINEPHFHPRKGWNGGHTISSLVNANTLDAHSTRSRMESLHPNMMDYLNELHKKVLDEQDELAETAKLELPDHEWIEWAKHRSADPATVYVDGILPPARWASGMTHTWATWQIADVTARVRRDICSQAISTWKKKMKRETEPGLVEIFRVAHLESPDRTGGQVYLHPQGCFLNIQSSIGRNAVGGERNNFNRPSTEADRDLRFMPTNEEYIAPFTLLAINEGMIHPSRSSLGGQHELRFGDYVVALRTYGDKQYSHDHTIGDYKKDSDIWNMVGGPDGVYDWVNHGHARSDYKIDFVAVSMEQLWGKLTDVENWTRCRDETVSMGLLSIVATQTLNMVDDDSSSIPDGSEARFIPTWKDRRKPKDLQIGTVGDHYKHDLIRCSMCNGATIIKTPLTNRESTADCPHCESKDGLIFPHLIDGGDIQTVFPRKESS